MKTLVSLILAIALAGCTHVRVQKLDGTVVDFYCTKNVRADLVKIGDVEIHGLHTDASGPIGARAALAGEVAKAAGAGIIP
jgi:hypothetical protein